MFFFYRDARLSTDASYVIDEFLSGNNAPCWCGSGRGCACDETLEGCHMHARDGEQLAGVVVVVYGLLLLH